MSDKKITIWNSLRVSLQTRYLGPTNTKGSRIQVCCRETKRYFPYPYELNSDQAHAWAAAQYCQEMGWSGTMVMGATGMGGYAFVFEAENSIKPVYEENLQMAGAV